MDNARSEETFAFAVVARVLGVDVVLYDTGARQRAVDGIVTYRDGRRAALEVTSIGPEDEARIANVLRRWGRSRSVSRLTKRWYVTLPTSFHPADLSTRLSNPAMRGA